MMKPSTAPQVTEMMKQVVQEGSGTAAALPGDRRRRQDRHRRARRRAQHHPAVVHSLRARRRPARGDRGDNRAVGGRPRRDRGGTDRQSRDGVAAQMTDRLQPETVVDGRYRIEHRLGSGGMADVYCATDLQLGRRVALKLLYHRYAEDAEFVERFRREASAAAGPPAPPRRLRLRPRRVGRHLLHRDGVPRGPLAQGADPRRRRRSTRDRAVDLTIQILTAARFAHQRGDHPPRPQAAERDRRRATARRRSPTSGSPAPARRT